MSTLPVIADNGEWVNGDYERLARIIQDYDPNLALGWIPPDQRGLHEKYPYAILDTTVMDPYTQNYKVIFHVEATETPEDVLTRLWQSDDKHGNVLTRLNARQAALEAWRLKTQHDELVEAEELATFLIKSNLNYMHITNSAGEKIKLDDQRRRIE